MSRICTPALPAWFSRPGWQGPAQAAAAKAVYWHDAAAANAGRGDVRVTFRIAPRRVVTMEIAMPGFGAE